MARRKKPKLSPKASAFIKRHIRRHVRKLRMPQSQAVAVAFAEAREKGFRVPRRPNMNMLRGR